MNLYHYIYIYNILLVYVFLHTLNNYVITMHDTYTVNINIKYN